MADTLSRSPIQSSDNDLHSLQERTEYLMETCINSLSASSQHLAEFHEAQVVDTVCSAIINYCQNESPTKLSTPLQIKPYWQARGQLTVHDDLLLYRQRIVVPAAMRQKALSKTHQGHQGIQKCHLQASISVWWAGISKHIRLDQAMPHLCKRVLPTQRTTNSYRSPRLPLAEDRNRFVLYEWSQLPTCC